MDAPIVVTGADGFIGRALCARLLARRSATRALTRTTHGDLADIDDATLDRAFAGAGAVVHLAGRAHVMDAPGAATAEAYRRANVVATERVARAAVRTGIRTLVYASSVKVNGEATQAGRPYTPHDTPAPKDDYGRSKLAAEQALRDIAGAAGVRVVTLRLPLVYGPGVKGNFRALWNAVARRRRLPLAAIHNRRSLVGLANLLDAMDAAMDAPAGVYFVADEHSVSTPDLARAMGAAQHLPARLWPLPVALLRAGGTMLGRRAAVDRLTQSLEVDASTLRAATGWQPRLTLVQGLAQMLRY